MKPSEILSSLPKWSQATPETLVASPAWAMQARLGDKACIVRLDAPFPADTLDIAIRLGDDSATLSIPDSPYFPELHAVWSARGEIPEPILLALVEKDCCDLLQLIENSVHRQLAISSISNSPNDANRLFARIELDGESLFTFSITSSKAIVQALGVLRNIDTSNPELRAEQLPCETQYAAFSLRAADAASLEQGDSLLIPEIDTLEPSLIVDGRFIASSQGVAAWKDDGLFRIVSATKGSISLGELFDNAVTAQKPNPEDALALLHNGKTIATGRLGGVVDKPAFICD